MQDQVIYFSVKKFMAKQNETTISKSHIELAMKPQKRVASAQITSSSRLLYFFCGFMHFFKANESDRYNLYGILFVGFTLLYT